MINTNMWKLVLLWNILTLMAVKGNSIDIKMDPGMRQGQPSYIYCDVGTVTAGVSFFTEPANLQGDCIAPGFACSSALYALRQNTSGVLLEIASVDASREEGEWYCQHDTDRSNTVTVNNHTIAGILLRQDWTKPSGPVDTFSALMTLSCTNKVPDFSFTYEDSESNSGKVPTEAVRTRAQSSYDGMTCENGNKFYIITLTASNKFYVFNNERVVKFTFTFYGNSVTAPFIVDLTATTPAIQTGPTAPSTGTQERNDLDCSGGRMRIHVPQTLLPTHIVTLRDPSCKVASNGSHLLADVGVNECGTTVSFTNDSVIFTNELVATALSGTTAPTIIDYGMNMKDQRVKISCIYPRENRIDFSYVPVMKEAHFYERQYGKLSFDVSQYSDEQFSHAIPHNGLPIGVTLNTELFIDISLRHASHKGVGIMVDSCIATPTSSPADPLWYTVIKDGCPAQQDVRTFASPDVDEFRFSFLVFRFTQAPLQKAGPNLPPTSMVFIHCQVSACPSQNCTNTCNPAGSHRVRREAELENSHLVSAGPFYLKSEEERGGYNGGVVAASVSMAVVATLVAIVALVAWRRSVNKLSKHQTLDEAS